MDILYLVGEGRSECNNLELRCSLRSIDKFGVNVGSVYVAGYCPDWLSDKVIKLPCKQPIEDPKDIYERHVNMLYTLLYAVDNSDISDEFLISMDDHFYVRKVDFDNYPFYEKMYGKNNMLPKNGKSPYKQLLAKTRRLCNKNDIGHRYLTLHRNMHCSRLIINEARAVLDKTLEKKDGYEAVVFLLNWWNTKYGLEITTIKDVKISSASEWYLTDPIATEVFSTTDFNEDSELYTLMCGRYPNKSKYEI